MFSDKEQEATVIQDIIGGGLCKVAFGRSRRMVSGGCQATWGEEDKEEEGVEEGAWAARHTPPPVWRARVQTDTHREWEGERE